MSIFDVRNNIVCCWRASGLLLRSVLLLAQITLLMCYPTSGFADDTIEREGKLKAAVIYYLAKFVKWPEGTFSNEASPVVICSLGENNVSKFLTSTMKGKNLRGHSLVVRSYSQHEETIKDEIQECNVIYIANKKFIKKKSELYRKYVLTVSDAIDITKAEGIAYLFEENNRIRIKINPKNAYKWQLKISSELLNIAVIEEN